MKEPLKGFHLNGHTTGFCPQTQKLELNYNSIISLEVSSLLHSRF